ncbi:unnamed protein product [Hyaloperonospora brassicae]|uniref:Methyltransferase domain-containing protein n=1 Tax=Hyaloperonospora brassicae TaxID=162125 RepID=A0AAV0V0Y1_HYABA|nr:unnamed protein product [Hyaloperonospora brassicae]
MKRVARRVQSWSSSREEVRLRFRCTECGKCCTGRGGRVRVNDRELQDLAEATNLSRAELERSCTRTIVEDGADGHKKTQVVLKQTTDDRQCIFLHGSKCSVYQARPTQCRTFPWWPQHLVSDYDWRLAAKDCEGISVDDERDGQERTPSYSLDDVMPEVVIHDIHRSGENFTYKELQQMLCDLREVEPEVVLQYKAEFFDKFSRRVVFNDDEVTVLDSLIDGPSRSFVFNNRLQLTQSEVALCRMPDARADAEPEFDRTALALEVHRALCMPLAWLLKRDKKPRPLRVSVLGAGACTLPLFLLEHISPRELGRLDAVEPSNRVNAIAKRFFGVTAAVQSDQRLVIHEKTGEDYLAEQNEDAAFDLLVLDVESGENCAGVLAPPLAMLESNFLITAKRVLVPRGILAINVIAESHAALEQVEAKLGHVFSHGLRLSLSANTTYFLFNEECDDDACLEVDKYGRLVKDSVFQTQHAQTPALLERCQLTAWNSPSAR